MVHSGRSGAERLTRPRRSTNKLGGIRFLSGVS